MGSIDTLQDSVVVRTTVSPGAPWPAVDDVGPITILWHSERLSRPTQITSTPNGDTVAIADRTEVFVLDRSGNLIATVGRRGEGPGEFTRIDGISPPYGDSIVIWDAGAARLTWMRLDGSVLRTGRVTPPGRFRGPKVTPLFSLRDAVALAWSSGFVRTDGTADSVVFGLASPAADGVLRVATIEDLTWSNAGGVVGPKLPFGPRALYAVSPGGRLAMSDGVSYCVRIIHLVEDRLPTHLCRDWERQAVGSAGGPPSGVEDQSLGRVGPMLRRVVSTQVPGKLRNSIDELRFDTEEHLWVRVVDSTHEHHPAYMSQIPGLRPAFYTWEVFDGEGRLMARVRIAGVFRPMWFGQRMALGFLDAEDGTVSVASVSLSHLQR